MISHEEGVEAATLQCLGEALEMLEIEISVRQRAGIPPGCGVNAYRAHECAQVQLTRGAHSCPILLNVPARALIISLEPDP
jgi:hypothetical protein